MCTLAACDLVHLALDVATFSLPALSVAARKNFYDPLVPYLIPLTQVLAKPLKRENEQKRRGFYGVALIIHATGDAGCVYFWRHIWARKPPKDEDE